MDSKAMKDRAARVLDAAEVDRILIVNTNSEDPNFVYITDLVGGLFEGNFLLIKKDSITLFTSPLEYELAREQLGTRIGIVNLDSQKKMELLVKELRGRSIGINGNFLPYNSYMRMRKRMKMRRIVDASAAFEKAREVKGVLEISRIRKANRITKLAIAGVQKHLKAGITEKEAARMFENRILELGADGPSFDSIVCFGKNAALPHHSPDSTRLRYGDIVLMDVGVKVNNYCSDVTRTMIFGNDKTRIKDYERKQRIIDIVREAQAAAIAAIKPGILGEKPHIIAQNIIDNADNGKYKGTFMHALGHSVGIEVHDGSGRFLSPGSKLVLREGMVSSVEPGIYIPGFGGARIEDDIVVTRNGAVIL